ncbi:GntR family transcriptional regulator [Phyllobacterium sp. SB3]|uniref:GntR family transcriptional regulator n=1 Tax=Phyllobacterium sp. SB3 TaxID=3156073 RepID=UPI0032AFCB26
MLRPVSLKVDVSPTLRKRVVDTLRNAIAQGELEAGERLVERVLCERTGVSRTSLREALRELENEGLVTNLPNRGVIISKLTYKDAKAIFEVRAMLESLICRLFCEKATPEQFEDCKSAFKDVVVAYQSDVPRDMIVAKSRLYDVLMAGADNEIAQRMLRSVHIRVSQLRMLSLSSSARRKASLAEMEILMAAFAARDAHAAEEASRSHVERAAESALEALD